MDLSQERDPKISYFFLHFKYGNRILPVWKFEANSIDVAFHPDMKAALITGHIILSRGRGMLEFSCKAGDLPVSLNQNDDKFDIVQLKVVAGSEKIINRREFIRHVFDKPIVVPQFLASDQSKKFESKVIDISAAGIGLACPIGCVEMGQIYYIQMPSGVVGDKPELWPVLVVRDFTPKSDALKGMQGYGAYFVSNKELVSGPVVTDRMQAGLVRFVNRSSILNRQLEK